MAENSAFRLLADRQKNKDDWALPSLDRGMPRILFPSQGFPGYQSQDTEMWNSLEPEQIEYGNSAYMTTLWRIYTGSNTSGEDLPCSEVVQANVDVCTLLRLHRELLESRNLLIRVCCNVRELCQSGISHGFISIVVVTDSRPGVATLQSVNVDQVYKFTQLVDSLFHALCWTLSRKTASPKVEQGIRGDVQTFMNNLEKLGDTFEAEVLAQSSRVGLQAMVDICRVIGHVLDVALLTYCGAHLRALDEPFLDQRIDRFEIYRPVLSTGPQAQTSAAVVLRRRSLSCLHKFLRERKVWVFHYGLLDNESSAVPDVKLYLSTSIHALADTWGPVWKVSPRNSIGTMVFRYSVVIGAIIPWTRVSESEPEALPKEAFCHWTPFDDDDDDEETAPTIDTQKHPLILIGGAPKLTMSPNIECRADPVSLLRTLKHEDCLQRSGTVKPYRYKDAETAQVQVGHGGAGLGGAVQWKHNPGITWKEYYAKSWKNEPDTRNPKLLEYWCGAEVSLCTFNTRRRRLSHILGSKTMRNHLSNVLFTWSTPNCEEAYYTALNSENPHAFYDLYVSRPDWRRELGTTVSLSFEVLLQTGLDNETDLKAFFAPTPSGDQEWLAILGHKKHSWGGLLKDSWQSATMAIATETCLEVSTPDWQEFPGQQCRQMPQREDRFSVLETKLICHQTSERRSPRNIHLPDSTLSIGDSGFLKVLIRLKHDGLLVRWKPRTPLLGKAQELISTCGQHSEHMEDQPLQAESFGLYAVSRKASKLSPGAHRPLRSNDMLVIHQGPAQAHTTHPSLDYLRQDHHVHSAASHMERTNTTENSQPTALGRGGTDVDLEQEDRKQMYVQPLLDVSRCICLSELEAETTVFGTTLTDLNTSTKAV